MSLDIRGLGVRLGGATILDGVDLSVADAAKDTYPRYVYR